MSAVEGLPSIVSRRPGQLHLVDAGPGDAGPVVANAPVPSTVAVCTVDQIVPERGVAALVGEAQVALFRLDLDGVPTVFGLDHRDPFTGANVLARGIVGSVDDCDYVASPLHKQRFDLRTGACLDADGVSIRTWTVEVVDDVVHVVA